MSGLRRPKAQVVVDPVVEVPLEKLRAWDENPRKLRSARLQDLMAAMTADREMLAARPVWARPDLTVFAGNQRLAAAKLLGWHTLPVAVVHGLSDSDVKRWALLDNNHFGEWDEEALPSFLADLLAGGVDGALTGFDTRQIDTRLASLTSPRDPDTIPEVARLPESQIGDIYQLGQHRLLCGDSTDPDALTRLLAGERVGALVTDFPWGVDYAGKTPEALTIANDSREGLPDFLAAAFAALDQVMAPDTPFYLFVPSGPAGTEFLLALRAVGWQHRQTLIWAKDAFVLGHSDYHNRHEAILYGFTGGVGRVGRGRSSGWYGGNDQGSLLFYDRPKHSRQHPTSKPVQLLARLIRNSTRHGDLVLDPFAGSGSTLLACELFGRCCAAAELEPRYADVIRNRYRAHIDD